MRVKSLPRPGVIRAVSAFVLTIALGGTNPARLGAQAPASPTRIAFDVVSIKRNTTPGIRSQFQLSPGRLVATAVSVRELLQGAYRLWSPLLIVDAPRWVSTDRFDIQAVGDVGNSDAPPTLFVSGASPFPTGADGRGNRGTIAESDTLRPRLSGMLQALLEDRFKLKAHKAMRDMSVYVLEMARADKRPGPKLVAFTGDCAKPAATGAGTVCGISGVAGKYMGKGSTMFDLALTLTNFPVVGRFVLDRTELSGRYDWSLEWTPTFVNSTGGAGIVANPQASEGVTLFGALQEQLGLKLRAETGPVDVVVIDSIEQPTED